VGNQPPVPELPAGEVKPYQGTYGKRPLFLDCAATRDVQAEVTGA
jgi:hypothetical protein